MDINSKREAALQLIKSTGMWSSSYNPRMLRMLWKLGIDLPPPPLASFSWNLMSAGLWFGIVWGVGMWFVVWSNSGGSITQAIIVSVITGALYGLFVASYFAYYKRKHNLPSWTEFKP